MTFFKSLAVIILVLLSILAGQLIITIARNVVAHRSFKRKLPNLPVLPNTSIIAGHADVLMQTGRNWLNANRLHEKYGRTFIWYYIDQPAVNTIDLDLIKKMILDNPDDNLERLQLMIPWKDFTDDNVAFVHKQHWYRLRKAIAPALTNHKILAPNVQYEMNNVLHNLISFIEEKLRQTKSVDKGFEIDTDDVFGRYAIALVFSCFYKQDDIVDFHAKTDPYLEKLDESCKKVLSWPVIVCPILPCLTPIFSPLIDRFHPLGPMTSKIKEFINKQTILNLKAKQQIKERAHDKNFDADNFILNDGTRFRRNLIDYVIDQFHAGKMSESEYMNSSFFLFIAATKTTADAVSRLSYLLAANGDVQTKLRDSILSDGLNSEYLQWCINESLRLFPPVTAGCSRLISKDLISKDGMLFPEGTLMVTPSYTIHHDRETWGPDVEEFKPDRWRDAKNFHPAQFIAFGLGKRNCLGKDFALSAIKKLMAEMIPRYEFLTSPKTNAESIQNFDSPGYIFLTPDTPTYIKIRPI